MSNILREGGGLRVEGDEEESFPDLAAELVQANLAAVETLGLLHLGSAQHASIEIVAPELSLIHS